MANVLFINCVGGLEITDEQGIASIASYLQENNHQVETILVVKSDVFTIDLKGFKPDVIGISAYHINLNFVYEIARYLKKQLSENVYIVLGGYSATYYYQDILMKCKEIDYIIRGEGEESFKHFCDCLDCGDSLVNVNNLVYRNSNNDIIANQIGAPIKDLNELGETKKDLLKSKNLSPARIITSRGCLGNCSFCYSHKFFDPSGKTKWRGRSPEKVVKEVVNLFTNYGVTRIAFDDASFENSLDGTKRMMTIVDLLIRENLPLSFVVFFRANIYKLLTENDIDKLLKAGLAGVFIGVESFNENDLILFNKRASVADNENVINYFRGHVVGTNIGFINFTPYSDIDMIRQNALYLHKHKFFGCSNTYINRLRLYKGIDLYDKVVSDGLYVENIHEDYFCYKYKNEEIGIFAQYINDTVDRLNAENHYSLEAIGYFYWAHDQNTAHYRRVFKKLGLDFDNDLDEADATYHSYIKRHNDLSYSWYCELLELLESGWDERKADAITDSYNLANESMDLYVKLRTNHLNLHKKILKRDQQLVKYLVTIKSDASIYAPKVKINKSVQ